MQNRTCSQCGRSFAVYPSRPRVGLGKTCSIPCRTRAATLAVAERFWHNVNKTEGCWVWTAGSRKGYGLMRVNGKKESANRISWELHNGPIPAGAKVLHHCDNPGCVRPDHLFLGTQGDNARDCATKQRNVFGERHHRARLTAANVLEILAERRDVGTPVSSLASRYGVSAGAVQAIAEGRSWKHLSR